MSDGSPSSHASPSASPLGDVKRLTMPTSPLRTKSGSGLPTSPTRGDKRASPAKSVSPFYSTRTNDTPETSTATDLFRKGAEQIVLDHEKQAKLANLIKAVTVQKQALTEEREQAIAGFKAERAKLRTMQQKTLSVYAKMKTEAIAPISVDIRDIDSSDYEGAGGVGRMYDMAHKAGSIFASLRRGSDERLVFERWRSWAKQRAVAEAHVRRMTRRWELARLGRISRAWWRLAVNDSRGIVAAAELAATRSKKRVGRRAFAAWRGVASGLDEEAVAERAAAILFGKTTRVTTRNVVLAWAATAARARALRLSDEVNTLRFEQAEAEAAAMVAAEEKAMAESEKKAAKSKSFLSAFRSPSGKSTDKKSPAVSPSGKSPLTEEAEPAKAAEPARKPDWQTSVASLSDDASPPAPGSPKDVSNSTSESGEEDVVSPAPAQERVAAKAKAPAADVADVEVETKEAAKTRSEDPPVDVPAAKAAEETEKKQPVCCVVM